MEVIPQELRGRTSVANRKSMQNDAKYMFVNEDIFDLGW